MYFYRVLLSFGFVITAIEKNACHCPFHPSLWCSSKEIAVLCEMESQCNKFIEEQSIEKVDFALYYETLCPDCQNFIHTQLWPTYKTIGNIMNISLIPYGNAKEHQEGNKWIFQCQHGEQECIANVLETCSIYVIKDLDTRMSMIYCMETSSILRSDPRRATDQCAARVSGVDFAAIDACANGTLGNVLEHQMALQTDKLYPPHTYVPWVTLFGVHTDDIQSQAEHNLLKLICDNYKGDKPSACKTPTTTSKCYL